MELLLPEPIEPSRDSDSIVLLCNELETLHADGVIVVAEDEPCEPLRVAEIEQMWKPAGLIGRPTDESIAAILTAESSGLPLICDDVSVHRLAEHCGLEAMTVRAFTATIAA